MLIALTLSIISTVVLGAVAFDLWRQRCRHKRALERMHRLSENNWRKYENAEQERDTLRAKLEAADWSAYSRGRQDSLTTVIYDLQRRLAREKAEPSKAPDAEGRYRVNISLDTMTDEGDARKIVERASAKADEQAAALDRGIERRVETARAEAARGG